MINLVNLLTICGEMSYVNFYFLHFSFIASFKKLTAVQYRMQRYSSVYDRCSIQFTVLFYFDF